MLDNLKMNIDFSANQGFSRNVDVGALRRVGKTSAIKTMILEDLQADKAGRVGVLVPNSAMKKDYQSFFIDAIYVSARCDRQTYPRFVKCVKIYSDEVPNAESILAEYGLGDRYAGGFFTRDPSELEEYQRNKETYNQVKRLKENIKHGKVTPAELFGLVKNLKC